MCSRSGKLCLTGDWAREREDTFDRVLAPRRALFVEMYESRHSQVDAKRLEMFEVIANH